MKKNFTHFLVLILTLVFISSCSKDDGDSDDIVGTIWHLHQSESYIELDYFLSFTSSNEANIELDGTIYGTTFTDREDFLYEYSDGRGILINMQNTRDTTVFKVLDNKLIIEDLIFDRQ